MPCGFAYHKPAALPSPSQTNRDISSVHLGAGSQSSGYSVYSVNTVPAISRKPETGNSGTHTQRKESVLSHIPASAGSYNHIIMSVRDCRASFLTSFSRASLTVEAAFELPVFFLVIVIVLQFAAVLRYSASFQDDMTQCAEEMAVAAYKEEYGDASSIIRAALSDAYAHSRVLSDNPGRNQIRNAQFLGSSYMKEDDRIRLVLSYQVKPKFSLIKIPWTFFIQKAVVRGWTGRSGSTVSGGEAIKEDPHQRVYITDHGHVFHTDPDCKHLKLTIRETNREHLKAERNSSGSRYKPCAYCISHGKSTGPVYITPYGECFHTCLDCPGLTRTTHEIERGECMDMCECEDCQKRGG